MAEKTLTPQVSVRYDEGHFFVKVPFALNHLVQELPDRRFWKSTREWKIPANWRLGGRLDFLLKKGLWTGEAHEVYANLPGKPAPVEATELPPYNFVYEPFGHQIEAYHKALPLDAYALFFEQGLGKTKTALDLAGMWYQMELITEVVICSPVSIMSVWEREIKAHLPADIEYQVQLLNTKKGIQWAKQESGLRIIVAGIESMSQGKAYEILSEYLESSPAARLFVLDEATKVKNHQATRTERVITLASLCSKRLILTGTPVTQGLQDLYSQFMVLGTDILALKSFYAFRNRYCIMGGYENRKVVGYKNVDELMDLIEPFSLRRTKEECLDLPEKIFQVRDIEMTAPQKKAYKELKRHLKTVIEQESGEVHTIEVSMMLEAYLRLQQITGGFIPTQDPDDGQWSISPMPGRNPKLEELVDVMDECQGKVVIFARFRAEVESISKILSNEKKVVEFHGSMSHEEKSAAVDGFQTGDADVFIATPQAAAYGLTLTAASTCIYYSMGFSLEEFLQSQDRIHRIGQERSCTYVMLQCRSSVDENVTTALMEKKSLADAVSERLENGLDPWGSA